MPKFDRLLLCSCEDSMTVEAKTARAAVGAETVVTARALCMGDADKAAKAFAQDGSTLVTCTPP